MNMSTSECNSGAESGWTSYLDQSSVSKYQRGGDDDVVDDDVRKYYRTKYNNELCDDEEDLSMVSDASSGPPHFNDDEDGYSYSTSTSSKSARKGERKKKKKNKDGEDTASSPVSNKNVLKHDISGTQVKGKSGVHKHFGLFQSEKTTSKKSGKF